VFKENDAWTNLNRGHNIMLQNMNHQFVYSPVVSCASGLGKWLPRIDVRSTYSGKVVSRAPQDVTKDFDIPRSAFKHSFIVPRSLELGQHSCLPFTNQNDLDP
jgi:hypothetical protein